MNEWHKFAGGSLLRAMPATILTGQNNRLNLRTLYWVNVKTTESAKLPTAPAQTRKEQTEPSSRTSGGKPCELSGTHRMRPLPQRLHHILGYASQSLLPVGWRPRLLYLHPPAPEQVLSKGWCLSGWSSEIRQDEENLWKAWGNHLGQHFPKEIQWEPHKNF